VEFGAALDEIGDRRIAVVEVLVGEEIPELRKTARASQSSDV